MPFKDTKEGTTHYDKDSCYKCGICGDHFFIENQAKRCNHDYAIAKEVLKTIPMSNQNKKEEKNCSECHFEPENGHALTCPKREKSPEQVWLGRGLNMAKGNAAMSSKPLYNPVSEKGWEEGLMEQLADIEHQRWADWQKWVHGMCVETNIVAPESSDMEYLAMAFPKKLYDRWERQINTSYAELSEKEKESDREQVRRYWPLIQKVISQAEATARREIIKKVRAMAKNQNGKKQYFGTEPYSDQGYNKALKDIITLITKEDND